jgi:hypothetical protein
VIGGQGRPSAASAASRSSVCRESMSRPSGTRIPVSAHAGSSPAGTVTAAWKTSSTVAATAASDAPILPSSAERTRSAVIRSTTRASSTRGASTCPSSTTTSASAHASELEARLATLPGGYVALIGPAGSGKSTLLASLTLPGRVARYYAFVPDAPDPLSGRGEADSFLHDLSLALANGGLYRSGYGNDLRSQRSVLLDQLDKAGQRWRDQGESTVIVVDGLDHIPREQNPERSMLEELPAPAALPEGVFVILGSQTTAILPAPVQDALAREGRVVDLPPLSAEEVGHIADSAGRAAGSFPDSVTHSSGPVRATHWR